MFHEASLDSIRLNRQSLFGVRMQQSQVFARRGPNLMLDIVTPYSVLKVRRFF